MTERRPPTARNDDEALSALLDGELSVEQEQTLRRRLADEPALAQRFEELRRAGQAVQATYAGIADEPLPRQLLDLLQPPADVTPLRAGPRPPRRFGAWSIAGVGVALAAGFLLALFVLPRPQPSGLLAGVTGTGEVRAGSAIHDVLERLPSGETRAVDHASTATPRLTFRSVGGDPCRRVDVSGADGVVATLACRREGGWRMEVVAFDRGAAAAPDGTYQPATDGEPSPVDDAIDDLIDGSPLGRDAESEWIARGWTADEG